MASSVDWYSVVVVEVEVVGPGGDRGAQTVAPIGRFRDPSDMFVMALRERKVVTNENNFSHGAWLLY